MIVPDRAGTGSLTDEALDRQTGTASATRLREDRPQRKSNTLTLVMLVVVLALFGGGVYFALRESLELQEIVIGAAGPGRVFAARPGPGRVDRAAAGALVEVTVIRRRSQEVTY